ncbi:MAG: lysylphosphatidylglycerol synthase transmembrane domain-containing protein [Bacteroidota bacterium]
MIEKVKKNIFIALAFSMIIYLLLSFYADFDEVKNAIMMFNWSYLILLFILSYLTFFIRYIKWEYCLKVLNIKISRSDSYQIFMSSLIMSITPGKVGELIKSYMIKQTNNIPVSYSAPIVLIERITEFLSLLLIGLIGLYFYEEWKYLVIVMIIILIAVIIFLSNEKIAGWNLTYLSKLKLINRHIKNVTTALSNSRKLLAIKPLLITLIISFISWISEGLIFYLILSSFDIDISILWSFFIYAFSIIVGSISMIPGGLGITEGSMTYLLVESGVAKNFAVAATLLFRIATLWFALLLGSYSLLLYQKKIGKSNFDYLNSNNTE